MKTVLGIALLGVSLSLASRAASAADFSYVCVSHTQADSSALVMSSEGAMNFFVQNYRTTHPINLLGSGLIDTGLSTPGTLVFGKLVDADGKPLTATDATSVAVTLSNGKVTEIALTRQNAQGQPETLIYDQNCIVDDGSN